MEEKLTRYIVKPSLQLFFGRKVTKDLTFDEWNKDKSVHQTFKNLVLITELNSKWNSYGIDTEEKSTLIQKVPENTILVWNENNGYVVPEYQMTTIDKLEEDLKPMEEFSREE